MPRKPALPPPFRDRGDSRRPTPSTRRHPAPDTLRLADSSTSSEQLEEPPVLVAATHQPGQEGASPPLSANRIVGSWILALSLAAVIASALQVYSGQRDYGFFVLSLTFVTCFGAAWTDIATRRIPNTLTYPAIILGLALNGVVAPILEAVGSRPATIWLGSPGALSSAQGFGLCALVGILSFIARGLGGGDVKLLGAVGALLGLSTTVAVLFNTLLVAAVLGALNWLFAGTLMRRLQSLAGAVYFSVVLRSNLRTLYAFKATEGPFALSLLAGLALAQFVALHQVIFSVSW